MKLFDLYLFTLNFTFSFFQTYLKSTSKSKKKNYFEKMIALKRWSDEEVEFK